MLEIKANLTGKNLEIALEGMLDTKTAPDLDEVIRKNIEAVDEINFDFTDLEYLTSAGLRVLLSAKQDLDDKGGAMSIKNVPMQIMKIFDMTGFADVLTIL